MKRRFEPGDRVAFSAGFLRSIGATTGWHCFARGAVRDVVIDTPDYQLVSISWDDGETSSANSNNLTLESRIAIDAALA